MINCQIGFCIVDHVRALNVVIRENLSLEELLYNAITRQLADIIDCNACIVNSKGRLLGYFMRYKPIRIV